MKIRVVPGQPLVEVGNARDDAERTHTEAVIEALLAEALGLNALTDVTAIAHNIDVYPGDGAYVTLGIRYPEVIE